MEGKEIHYVTKSDRTLLQLSTRIDQKRMIVKYKNDVKYVQIFDNEKGAKYPGIVLKYDEYLQTCSDLLLMDKGEHFFRNPLPATVFPKRTGTFTVKSLTYDSFEPAPTASPQTSQTASLPTNPTVNRPPSPTVNQPPSPTVNRPLSPTANRPSSECQHGEEKCELDEEDMQTLTNLLEVIGGNEDFPAASTDCFPHPQLCAIPVAILPVDSTPAPILPADSTPAAIIPTGTIPAPILSGDLTYAPPTSKILTPYQPAVEPISPAKVKKGLKVKNPGFKRYRTFPFSSLPSYKEIKSVESPM